jgi:hypothetical protein
MPAFIGGVAPYVHLTEIGLERRPDLVNCVPQVFSREAEVMVELSRLSDRGFIGRGNPAQDPDDMIKDGVS